MPSTAHADSVPGCADLRILCLINQLDVLLARQVQGFLYGEKQLPKVRLRLKKLSDTGYLYRLAYTYRRAAETYKPGGSSPALYTLSGKGWSYLRSLGYAVPRRLNATEKRARKQLPLEHTVALNDLILLLTKLARTYPQIQIARLEHESSLKRNPVAVTFEGRRQLVIPDAWIDLRYPHPEQAGSRERACFCIEVDRGTMHENSFKEKIRLSVPWSYHPYTERFGTELCQILWVTTASAQRRDELLRWCAEELQKRSSDHERGLFLFAFLDVERATEETLAFTPIWYEPFAETPKPLLSSPVPLSKEQRGRRYAPSPLWRSAL